VRKRTFSPVLIMEDIGLYIGVLAGGLSVLFFIFVIIVNVFPSNIVTKIFRGVITKPVYLSDNVYNSLYLIFKDSSLRRDFKSILIDEGDITQLLLKIDADLANSTTQRIDYVWSELEYLDEVSIKSFNFQVDALRIASLIVKKESFRAFSITNNLNGVDQEMMRRIFYLLITTKKFKYVALDLLLDELDFNIPVFSSFELDGPSS
jgi:hypothetical protein